MRDFEDKKYDAAAAQAERVLKIAPQSPAARRIVAQARQRKQELDAAVAQTRRTLEAGDTDAASRSLSQLLELDPRHPAAAELSRRLNTVFRSRAEDALRSMRQARGDAEKAKATTGEAYAQAAAFAQEGEALFARSEFANATRAFLESRDGFDRARRSARTPVAATAPPPSNGGGAHVRRSVPGCSARLPDRPHGGGSRVR